MVLREFLLFLGVEYVVGWWFNVLFGVFCKWEEIVFFLVYYFLLLLLLVWWGELILIWLICCKLCINVLWCLCLLVIFCNFFGCSLILCFLIWMVSVFCGGRMYNCVRLFFLCVVFVDGMLIILLFLFFDSCGRLFIGNINIWFVWVIVSSILEVFLIIIGGIIWVFFGKVIKVLFVWLCVIRLLKV